MGFKIFILILIIFIGISLLISILSPIRYKNSLNTIRKFYYSFFTVTILIALIFEETSINNWPFLLSLAGIIIFIDISIILTPMISKFFQAEFIYEAESLAELGEKTIDTLILRAAHMSDLIQLVEVDLWTGEDDNYLISLDNYLKKYTEKFGIKAEVFKLNTKTRGTLTSDMLREDEINGKMEEFLYLYSINPLTEWVEALKKSKIVSTKDESFFVVPVYMEQRELLIVLLVDKGNLFTIDAIHITNLVYMYYENLEYTD